jgi:hypothetical protein
MVTCFQRALQNYIANTFECSNTLSPKKSVFYHNLTFKKKKIIFDKIFSFQNIMSPFDKFFVKIKFIANLMDPSSKLKQNTKTKTLNQIDNLLILWCDLGIS